MYRELCEAAGHGATVLTGSQRLSRAVTEAFADFERERGRALWASPDIIPWNGYLRRCWTNWLLSGSSEKPPLLLNSVQEAEVWRQIVEASPEGRTLLRIPETASQAMEAWDLVLAYQLPIRGGQFSASEDCEAFAGWAREFERRRDQEGWLEQAKLPEFLANRIRAGELEPPAELWLAGFEEFTPRSQMLLEALGEARTWIPQPLQSRAVCRGLRDSKEEIRQAAVWARDLLEQDSSLRIGVIVPGLGTVRSVAARIFGEALGSREAFHISLGAPLSRVPLIHSALLLLEFALGPLPIGQLGVLLRSPFLLGAEKECSGRALLDASLRKDAGMEVSLGQLRKNPGLGNILRKNLSALAREIETLPEEQYASQWPRSFASLLRAAGWPGDRALESEEYQAAAAWNSLLATFASLAAVAGRFTFSSALHRLRRLAEDSVFGPEDEGAPVQILGLFEATGLHFDHLWVMGLHDRAVPAPARPNPFLPVALQREHGLPHSSPEREFEYSQRILNRLLASAPEVALSYPQIEGDQPLGPSPLLNGMEAAVPGERRLFISWPAGIHAGAPALESAPEIPAPPLAAGASQHGGASLLKDMAACPFRAFAQHRLGARPLQAPEFGMSPREKGNAAHDALAGIWGELRTHAALCASAPEEIRDLVARSVEDALPSAPKLGRMIEARRLESLLLQWLAIERARPPFEVVATESKTEVAVGGLQLEIRADRVDELEDGRRLILDYKTGNLAPGCWSGDRPGEPQLPLYCVTSQYPVAGAAFVVLRAGELGFRGAAENGEFGRLKAIRTGCLSFAGLLGEWRKAVHNLAEDFRMSRAEADPKEHACEYCAQTPLCRIRDARRLENGGDSDE